MSLSLLERDLIIFSCIILYLIFISFCVLYIHEESLSSYCNCFKKKCCFNKKYNDDEKIYYDSFENL